MARHSRNSIFGSRLPVASAVVCICFAILGVRLWYLQCFRGSYYRDLSENNRTRTVRTIPARGNIYDREGKVLVTNRPAFTVGLMLEDVPNIQQTLSELSTILGKDERELEARIKSQRSRRHFEPKAVMEDVPRDLLAKVKVNSYRLPGVIIDVVPTRLYPFGSLAAQMFGYAREITKAQLEVRKDYRQGDAIGQSGLERTFEERLRGRSGYRQIEVDAMGNRTGELGIRDDLPGQDLYLTIDRDIQRVAEQALAGRRGAVVGLDPRTGEVLVLASSPTFDPNIFSGPMEVGDWERVAKDRNEPLTNRAISQVYPAGSTFKLITTVAALAEKKISPDTAINCPGYYFFAGRRYRCHKKTGHGPVTMKEALTHSCNAYYFQLGQMLGIDLIHKWSTRLGLGAKSGIELPGEVPGIVPSEKWKLATYGERWYPGDTLPVSIGQGYIVVTPMQMAIAMSTIANGGVVHKPFLVRKAVDRLTGQVSEFGSTIVNKVDVPSDVFALTRSFSMNVVKAGTGKAAGFKHISVGGKTGTAQVSALGTENRAERLMDHAWFVSFAPVEAPTIVLAVIIENGGHGGTAAAPVAKTIYTEYFRKQGLLQPDEEGVQAPAEVEPTEMDEGFVPEEEREPAPPPATNQATAALHAR